MTSNTNDDIRTIWVAFQNGKVSDFRETPPASGEPLQFFGPFLCNLTTGETITSRQK